MQLTGHINIDGNIMLVLLRVGRPHDKYCHTVFIKLRKSGQPGHYFCDESDYLNNMPDLVRELKAGNVIEI